MHTQVPRLALSKICLFHFQVPIAVLSRGPTSKVPVKATTWQWLVLRGNHVVKKTTASLCPMAFSVRMDLVKDMPPIWRGMGEDSGDARRAQLGQHYPRTSLASVLSQQDDLLPGQNGHQCRASRLPFITFLQDTLAWSAVLWQGRCPVHTRPWVLSPNTSKTGEERTKEREEEKEKRKALD